MIEYEYETVTYTYTYYDDDGNECEEERTRKEIVYDEELTVPDGVVTIADGALSEDGGWETYCTTVTIPKSVKYLDSPFMNGTTGSSMFTLTEVRGYRGSAAETWANENVYYTYEGAFDGGPREVPLTFVALDDEGVEGDGNDSGDNGVTEPIRGDLDGDGVTDSSDLFKLKKYLLGIGDGLDASADLNGDGKVNVLDLLLLKRYLLGLVSSLD